MTPGISEEEYIKRSKFSIPECFQIPTLPEQVVPKPIPVQPPVCPERVVPPASTPVQPKQDPERKLTKKRVTSGMKLTRNQIDIFTEESSDILSKLSALSVDLVPIPEVPVDVLVVLESDL